CGGAATLCGEPLELCTPVPQPDAQAAGGPDRRTKPFDIHPAKDRRPESALDRRYDHRDKRLLARAVCAGRARILPKLWAANRCADSRADRGHDTARIATWNFVRSASADRSRPEGRIQGPLRGALAGWVRARPRRRPGAQPNG